MATLTQSQKDSQARLKATIKSATPGGSVSANKDNPLYKNKNITPGLKVTQADYTQAKAGGPATPKSDLEAARIAYEASLPKPKTDIITSINSNTNITGGSDRIRGEQKEVRTTTNGLLGDIGGLQDTAVSDTQKRLGELDKMLADMNKFNEMDLDQIRQAGLAEGAKYDPLIAEAKESKTQGLAKATVGAGERGGFMNTQYAGQAALTPTEGGNFVGAGGELSRVKGVLDRNIQNLEMAKISAISEAENAARKAIRTGKKEDMKLAQDIYDRAQAAYDSEQNMILKRVDTITKLEGLENDRQTNAISRLKEIAQAGISPTLEDQQFLDANYGEGFTSRYWEAQKKAFEAENEKDQVSAATDIIGILNDLPYGEEIQIGNNVYKGLKMEDPNTQIFSEEDAAGNVTYVTLDKNTGQVIGTVNAGKIGKGFKGSGNSNSSGNFSGGGILSYEQWLAQQPEFVASVAETDPSGTKAMYNDYLKENSNIKFTSSEQKKLLAGGMGAAPLMDQLEYLNKKKDEGDEAPSWLEDIE